MVSFEIIFQVCELHFRPEDIKRESSAFDKKTGKTITVKLERTYLYDGAIPRILPNCPSYLSSSTSFRKSPHSKKIQRENFGLKRALDQNIADDLAYKKQKCSITLMI